MLRLSMLLGTMLHIYIAALHIQQEPPGVLNNVLDSFQEGDSLAAINESVVICQGHIHYRPSHDLTVDHHGTLVDAVHAHNGRLWWIDDGCAQETAVDTTIGDSESTTCHVINGNGAVACLLAEIVDGLQGDIQLALLYSVELGACVLLSMPLPMQLNNTNVRPADASYCPYE